MRSRYWRCEGGSLRCDRESGGARSGARYIEPAFRSARHSLWGASRRAPSRRLAPVDDGDLQRRRRNSHWQTSRLAPTGARLAPAGLRARTDRCLACTDGIATCTGRCRPRTDRCLGGRRHSPQHVPPRTDRCLACTDGIATRTDRYRHSHRQASRLAPAGVALAPTDV